MTCEQQQPSLGAEAEEQRALSARMAQIKHKLLVLSGKGGVGKSTVAVNLAVSLAMAGKKVGILDVDLHGPSVPKLLLLENETLSVVGDTLLPVKIAVGEGSLFVMSVGFALGGRDDAVIWRGPKKAGVIRQFLKDVEWGELDYLVVDAPPGTGDEPLAAVQMIGDPDGAVLVTTPQEVAVQDVRRCVRFCRELGVPILGVVENMRGFVCPKCGEQVDIFGTDGGRVMADELDVPYLTAVPISAETVVAGDSGMPVVRSDPHSETAKAFGRIARAVLETLPSEADPIREAPSAVKGRVTVAVPVSNGVLAAHFGHCEQFVLYDVEEDGRTVGEGRSLTPPPHEPGTFPKWLREQGATVVIAGGMGSRAQSLFEKNGIQTVVGAVGGTPDEIVRFYLDGSLRTGANACDH